MKGKIFVCTFLIYLIIVTMGACGKKEEPHKAKAQMEIITTIFPLYDFAKHIGGERARVSLLMPPGVEAHSFEPKPGDIVKINKAHIFIYTGEYMEPWITSIKKGIDNRRLTIIDASKGIQLLATESRSSHDHPTHEQGKMDPHIWLDFANAEKMVDTICNALVEKDPLNKDYYTKNADTYKAQLRTLDRKFTEGLSRCRHDTFIHGGHFAFSYLAKRYNLKYFSAYPGSANSEPTMKDLMALKKRMKDKQITTIFYEELIQPRVAEMISKDTGARMLKLHAAGNVGKDELERGVTFIALMEENLKNLKAGLQCQEK